MKLTSTKNKISIKLGDAQLIVKPLTLAEKSMIGETFTKDTVQGSREMIKSSIHDMVGFSNEDDTPYIVERDSDGRISDKVVDDIQNSLGDHIATITSSLMGSNVKKSLEDAKYEYTILGN